MKNLYIYITNQLHVASLLITLGFDPLWSVFEGGSTASIVGIILMPLLIGTIFIASFGAVTLVQRYAARDEWQAALSKGLALGIFAAIPFSVVGMVAAAGWGFMRLTYGVDQEVILLGKLTKSWREIEGILRRLAPPEMRRSTLEEVIDHLQAWHLLSNSLADQLHDLRRQRNKNVHEFTTNELAILVDNVQAMQNTLRLRFLTVS